jgi:hypothetical protein
MGDALLLAMTRKILEPPSVNCRISTLAENIISPFSPIPGLDIKDND